MPKTYKTELERNNAARESQNKKNEAKRNKIRNETSEEKEIRLKKMISIK